MGFSLCANPQIADIYVGYSAPGYKNPVTILLNKGESDKISRLTVNGENIPLFCRPVEQTGGYVWGKVTAENREYPGMVVSRGTVQLGFNIFAQIGRILSGEYDSFFLKGDELGRQLRSIPVVDVLEDALFSAIEKSSADLISKRFTWPDNHKFALVLTHDVDRVFKTYQYLPSIFDSIRQARPAELGYHLRNFFTKRGKNNPYWTFEAVKELESGLGVKSTWYFLNETGRLNPFSLQSWILYRGVYDIKSPPIKAAIRGLAAAGHEIGVHGSYNSYNDEALIKKEKQTLESITGFKMKGIRQHYLNYDSYSTPAIHSRNGFQYDSSIGYKPTAGAGFRRGTSFPFHVMLPGGKTTDLLEIPLIIMDGALESSVKIEDCYRLIDQVEKYGGVLTLLWHNNRLNPREYPGMVEYYRQIIDRSRAKGAWIARADEVYGWMMGRQNRSGGTDFSHGN